MSTRTAIPRIQATKNYSLFQRDSSNRETHPEKRKLLQDSMKTYGFLPCYPIIVYRNAQKLIVKDGQNRLAIAEQYGLTVFYVVHENTFDTALVNSGAEKWKLSDYAEVYARNGEKAYQEALEFATTHRIPLGLSAAMLHGTSSFSNIKADFLRSKFRVRDRAWAERIAAIYVPMIQMQPQLKGARFIEACMAVCRVEDFDGKRLVQAAQGCREKLAPYSTRDAFLGMLEEVYNFRRSKIVGLKAAALMAMRERSPAKKKAA